MARDNDDVTEGRDDGETPAARRARNAAFGTNPLNADQMAEAIAKAHMRVADEERKASKTQHIPETVRASVRCGSETIRETRNDGGVRLVTRPKKITFKASETADNKEWTVEDGRPVRLKREAFLRYQSTGDVILAQ